MCLSHRCAIGADSLVTPQLICQNQLNAETNLKFYQFIDYDAIYGTGGRLC